MTSSEQDSSDITGYHRNHRSCIYQAVYTFTSPTSFARSSTLVADHSYSAHTYSTMFSSALAFTLSLVTAVSAHGYLRYVDHKGITYGAWQVFSDPYLTPLPLRYDRSYRDNGPVVDFTGSNITCNNGPNDGTNVGFINVNAGDKVYVVSTKHSFQRGVYLGKVCNCYGRVQVLNGWLIAMHVEN